MPLKQGARSMRDPCGEDPRSRGSERAEGIRAPGWAGGVPMGRVTGRFASHHIGAAGFPGIACPGWRAQTEHPQRSTHANCRPTLSSCKKQETPSPCNVPLSPSTEKTMRLLFKKQERQPGGGIASIIAEHVLRDEFGAESHKFRTDTRLK